VNINKQKLDFAERKEVILYITKQAYSEEGNFSWYSETLLSRKKVKLNKQKTVYAERK
jgi:hypothetical protein